MELRHLRYFVSAAEEGSISAAAARSNLTQPAVSRQIRDFESELGVALFKRIPSGLELTPAGNITLAYAREILRQTRSLQEALTGMQEDGTLVTLRIGYLPTALSGFLSSAMRSFRERFPKARLEIFEMNPQEQADALQEGRIDVAFLGEPKPELRDAFQVKTIREIPMSMVVPLEHPLATRKQVTLSEFAKDPFISLDPSEFPDRPRLMRELFSAAEIEPAITHHARGLAELLAMVGSGMGVALAPADAALLPSANLVFLELKQPQLVLQFSAAWRRIGDNSIVETFLACIMDA